MRHGARSRQQERCIDHRAAGTLCYGGQSDHLPSFYPGDDSVKLDGAALDLPKIALWDAGLRDVASKGRLPPSLLQWS